MRGTELGFWGSEYWIWDPECIVSEGDFKV